MRRWGYWNDYDNIKKEAIDIINKHGTVVFTYKGLCSLGLHSFINGLSRSEHSLEDLCVELNIKNNSTSKGHWKNLNNIIRECNLLINKYGSLPTRETIKAEKKLGMLNAISKFHGGLNNIRKLVDSKSYESNLSILERTTKHILDKYIKDENYIDNGRKSLIKYGLNTMNPVTGYYLEIDRYYYDLKIAIEINGQQHYKKGGVNTHWTEESYKRTHRLDKIKSDILKENNIKLIYISYKDNTEEKVINLLNKHKELGIEIVPNL